MKISICETMGIMAVLAAAMMIVAADASAEIIDLQWDGSEKFSRELGVAPGKFAEVCGKLSRGESVAWNFDTDGPTNFNVHYHEGARVVFPAKQDAVAKAEGRLDVQLDQDYCWMWANKSDKTVRLRLSLQRRS